MTLPTDPAFAAASERCADAKPNRLLETSASAGWRSLLLDHHEGAGRSDVFETHPTEDLTLVVATTGRHDLEAFAQGRWRLAPYQTGNAGLTPPGESARLRWRTLSETQLFRTLHLYLPGSLIASVAEEYRRIGRPVSADRLSALVFRDEAISNQARLLLAACRDGEPDLYAAGAARWLATHLLSRQARWVSLEDDPRLPGIITDRRLARVIEFMSAHLDRALSLDALAREAGISVHHFGRRFREATGSAPAAYLTTLRMSRARVLLRTTDLAVAEIGVLCGYPRASAFTTAFLRHVGESPRRYRRER